MKPKTIAGLVLMVGFASILFLNFGEQVGGYMDFSEAQSSGARAHVVGTWVKQQHFNYDRDQNVFTFVMQDESGQTREIRYHNPKPPNFEDAEQVVVEGQMDGEVFVAEHILIKCPSKYNDAQGIEEMGAS
jgi:cytochrome c-type biogenesis protein CcmE